MREGYRRRRGSRHPPSDEECLVGSTASTKLLELLISSFQQPRLLEVRVNQRRVLNTTVGTGLTHVTIPIRLARDENQVELISPEGCERPLDMTHALDERCLSFYVEQMRVRDHEL